MFVSHLQSRNGDNRLSSKCLHNQRSKNKFATRIKLKSNETEEMCESRHNIYPVNIFQFYSPTVVSSVYIMLKQWSGINVNGARFT